MSLYLEKNGFCVRQTEPKDFIGIQEVCLQVYPFVKPWNLDQLASHINIFPQGQLVVEDLSSGRIVGMAASLIVLWEDYEMGDSWSDFTDKGFFTNHDPLHGRTLYGAEIMVDPRFQGRGLGRLLYEGRRTIVENLGLLRIRAGARLRGYQTYAKNLSPKEYLLKVLRKEVFDPTLSFQLKEGFRVISLVPNYLHNDPESLGNAVVIEWLNKNIATSEHFYNQKVALNKIFVGMNCENENFETYW
ncbi:MAG: GNAT family N-acetyltransferase [Bdellovibrionaceae bacterium]|nr:GNAT family N-acetyltransferase [Pseudobdellovibrionaceae bacterium]